MKIIDLLNKIANGEEVPEKILYKETLYTYNEGIDYKNNYGNFLMDGSVYICPEDLNNRVEIIEEPQGHKIPKKLDEELASSDDMLYKINEILDYLEENKK